MRHVINRWWRGIEESIVVDVRATGLLMARRPTKKGAAFSESPIPLAESLVTDVMSGLGEREALVCSLLRACLDDVDTRYARLGVSLPSQSILVSTPLVENAQTDSNIDRMWEGIYDALSLDQAHYIVRAIPHRTDTGSESSVIIATKRAIVEFWERVAQALGIELTMVVPRACALHSAGCRRNSVERHLTTVWVDVTEQSPRAHRFERGLLARSCAITDDMDREDIFMDASGGSDARVKCVTHPGQNIDEVFRLLKLDLTRARHLEWLPGESIVARGVMEMMDEWNGEA